MSASTPSRAFREATMAESILSDIGVREIGLTAYAAVIIGLGTYHRWLFTHNDPRSKTVLVVSLLVIAPAILFLDGGNDG
jgi:hypothetical protein